MPTSPYAPNICAGQFSRFNEELGGFPTIEVDNKTIIGMPCDEAKQQVKPQTGGVSRPISMTLIYVGMSYVFTHCPSCILYYPTHANARM